MDEIYYQVGSSTTSCGVLGISVATHQTVRSAYRSLVLLLHPDKCPSDKAALHSSLFLKVQDAYEALLKDIKEEDDADEPFGGPGEEASDEAPVRPMTAKDRLKALKELHARNMEAKERLQKERERAVADKKAKRPKRKDRTGYVPFTKRGYQMRYGF